MDSNSKRKLQRRFWLKAVIGAVTGVLSVVTPIWPDWIEAISGWDPDQHDGSAEWMIVTALLIVTVSVLAMAAREWQQLKVAEASLATIRNEEVRRILSEGRYLTRVVFSALQKELIGKHLTSGHGRRC
jgi:hypothetical protein